MAELTADILEQPVVAEISILNVEKPPLDYIEVGRRARQFKEGPKVVQFVWLTRAATFEEKSKLFPNATFVVGVDTIRRIVDPKYYANSPVTMLQSIERIIARGCRFLVFGRALDSSFIRLSDIELPACLLWSCQRSPGRTISRRHFVYGPARRRIGGDAISLLSRLPSYNGVA